MTAPASAVQKLQKNLANGAPSTHDPEQPFSGELRGLDTVIAL
jgi:hypothetical protein